MSNKQDLRTRMIEYENAFKTHLPNRLPLIIRIDGRAFHNFTKSFFRPFDDVLIMSMQQTAMYLCQNITNCKIAYTQSDEISLLLIDYERNETQPWLNNKIQKLVSISASMATMSFNKVFANNVMSFNNALHKNTADRLIGAEVYNQALRQGAMFDARAFILPKEEVCNYFIYRQLDATRNSIQMMARSLYSHSEVEGKKCNELQEMMFKDHSINYNSLNTMYKRGSCVVKSDAGWMIDRDIPVFTKDREYIDKIVYNKEVI